MYSIIIRLILVAALLELGISVADIDCLSDKCSKNLRHAADKVLRINWKPISVFPEEAKQFLDQQSVYNKQ